MRRLTRTQLVAVLLLAACTEDAPPRWQYDQCMRREIFDECMRVAIQVPTDSRYSDSAEVVSECDSAAYEQARRPTEQIPAGCRPF